MKRLALFICVLFLMLDLADDGRLGKAIYVVPHSPVKSLQVSSSQNGSVEDGCHGEVWQDNFQYTPLQFPGRPIARVIQHTRKIIHNSNLSSSGGIPRVNNLLLSLVFLFIFFTFESFFALRSRKNGIRKGWYLTNFMKRGCRALSPR